MTRSAPDAQRVQLAAAHVAHDQEAQHLLEVVGARIDLVVLDGAERPRALAQRAAAAASMPPVSTVTVITGPAVMLGHPRHQERGVEAAGIGEDNGLGARSRRQ